MSSGATIKLYDENSFQKEFTALVQSCTRSGDFFKVELDKTAFFPEGGGQYADKGKLILDEKEIEVFDVQIDGKTIYHFVKEGIEVSSEVVGIIDFETRFTRMQNHSAEHIVSGLIHSSFGFDNIGFHLSDEDVTCDYNGALSEKDISLIERKANEAVFKNIAIDARYPSSSELKDLTYRSKLDLTEDVRIVTIDGIDVCACCAPHVHNTGEIGLIKIINHEKSHGGTRLHLRAGFMALLDYDEKQNQVLKIGDLLSGRQFELSDLVLNLQKTNSNLSYKLSKMSERVALTKLESIEKIDGNLVMDIDDADSDTFLAFANGGKEKVTGLFVALTENADGFRYIIISNDKELKLSQMARDINASLNGRGGGKDEMIQGVFKATLKEIEDYFMK